MSSGNVGIIDIKKSFPKDNRKDMAILRYLHSNKVMSNVET
jgi:hypothetical protein